MAVSALMESIFGKDFRLTVSNELLNKYQVAVYIQKQQIIDFGRKCQMVHDVEYGDGAVTFLSTPQEIYEQTYKTQAQ